MLKMVAILGLVAGGAGYAAYSYTDLFGGKDGGCGRGCELAVKKSCCEGHEVTAATCCDNPCPACAEACDGCPLCETDCSACCGETKAVSTAKPDCCATSKASAAKADCCAAAKPCCDTVEACCPTAKASATAAVAGPAAFVTAAK